METVLGEPWGVLYPGAHSPAPSMSPPLLPGLQSLMRYISSSSLQPSSHVRVRWWMNPESKDAQPPTILQARVHKSSQLQACPFGKVGAGELEEELWKAEQASPWDLPHHLSCQAWQGGPHPSIRIDTRSLPPSHVWASLAHPSPPSSIPRAWLVAGPGLLLISLTKLSHQGKSLKLRISTKLNH